VIEMEVGAISHAQQLRSRKVATGCVLGIVLLYGLWQGSRIASVPAAPHPAAAHAVEGGEHDSAEHVAPVAPAIYSIIPFAVLLLCIALFPLFHRTAHWWEVNRNKLLVSLTLAVVILLYYALVYGQGVHDHMSHTVSAPGWAAIVAVLKNALLVDYIPFIILLFSLFVVSGGISVDGHLIGRPTLNTGIIGIGSLLASLIGTTGAAMVLIRPLLKANAKREHVKHTVVFFIFAVCNTGGCLLPIGDPPLFLGYLRGVPFTWTLSLWPQWLFMNLSILAIYFVWDRAFYRRENHALVEALPDEHESVRIRGKLNFLWLAGVIASAALLNPDKEFLGTGWTCPLYFREIAMLTLAMLSLWTVSPAIRHRNSFNYDAIEEVAVLFVGIFICMQAPLQILDVYGAQLGIDQPWKFYWATGMLSSFLDNAPTYAVFFEIGKKVAPAGSMVPEVLVGALELAAISLGAVFMGAMTYIGNGPNFMVKTIAEKSNVKMPSFFGYMAYSCGILLPISILMTWIFF
jgi:Na+/H+ antiporter NhaD/arsenite permease-like protein